MIQDFSLDYFSLKGKVAIITGGNTHLGRGYAVALAKAGADIFIPHFEEDITEVKELVENEGRKIAFLQGDLYDPDYRKAVVDTCIKEFGHIDILINNAGAATFHDFREYPEDDWRKVIDLNLTVPFLLGQAVAKKMIEAGNGGRIINIGSSLSFQADCGSVSYAPSKHGVIGLTRMFAMELGKYGITSNAICPGWFAGPMDTELVAHPEFTDYIDRSIPMRRWGKPEDLMGTVVYLASKASEYLNGWAIHVDGGKCCTFSCEIDWTD